MKHAVGIISVTISTVTFKSSLKNKNMKAQNNKLLSLAGKHLFSQPAREENQPNMLDKFRMNSKNIGQHVQGVSMCAFNPFHATGLAIYPLKQKETCFYAFKVYINGTFAYIFACRKGAKKRPCNLENLQCQRLQFVKLWKIYQ